MLLYSWPILVITVAHNPLQVTWVPVYTNQCKHSWSTVKLPLLKKLWEILVHKVTIYFHFKIRDNNTFWWENPPISNFIQEFLFAQRIVGYCNKENGNMFDIDLHLWQLLYSAKPARVSIPYWTITENDVKKIVQRPVLTGAHSAEKSTCLSPLKPTVLVFQHYLQ